MPFKNAPQCKICRSSVRYEIDKMLGGGSSSTEIIAFAKTKRLTISRSNLSRHNNRHRNKEVPKQKDSAANDSVRQGPPVIEYVHPTKLLDLIVAKGYEGILSGHLQPTVSDAIKAKALLHKMGVNKDPVQEALLKYISGVSQENPA